MGRGKGVSGLPPAMHGPAAIGGAVAAEATCAVATAASGATAAVGATFMLALKEVTTSDEAGASKQLPGITEF